MPVLAAKVHALRARAPQRHIDAPAMTGNGSNVRQEGAAISPHNGGTNGTRQCVFRREGPYWTIEREGNVGRILDLKGLHYIAHMVKDPGQGFMF